MQPSVKQPKLVENCHFKTVKIDSWAELLTIRERLPERTRDKWVFRGLSNAAHPLATSLERALRRFESPSCDAKKLEHQLLTEFRRRVHHYISDVPQADDVLEWLSLMRHYGAPTRLLDWTYSPHVATYFAVSSVDADQCQRCAVWALDTDWYNSRRWLPQFVNSALNTVHASSLPTDRVDKVQAAVISNVIEIGPKVVIAVNPFRLNERLTVQQGLFLVPGDISVSFETNLLACNPSPNNLVRFDIGISVTLRREILLNLHRMNISHTSLYPGLIGFSQSLAMVLAFPDILRPTDYEPGTDERRMDHDFY